MATVDKFKQYQTVDVIAASIAASAFHKKAALNINPSFDYDENVRPTKDNWITSPKKEDETFERVLLSPMSHYVRMTLTGEKEKFQAEDVCEVAVLQEHKDEAAELLTYIKGQIVMNVLKGKEYTGFMASLIEAIDSDTATLRDIGLLTYVPSTAKSMAKEEATNIAKFEFRNSRAIGSIGDKVTVVVTIIGSRTLPQYDSVVFEAHDSNDNLISFFVNADKAQYEIGETYTLKARVKAAEANKYSNGVIINSLNYVKRVA